MFSFRTLSGSSYDDKRYEIVLNVEENGTEKLELYFDSNNSGTTQATIGAGFNIDTGANTNLLDAVLDKILYSSGGQTGTHVSQDATYRSQLISTITGYTYQTLDPDPQDNIDANGAALRTLLDAVMAARAADGSCTYGTKATTFDFSSSAEVETIFNSIADSDYESEIDSWLSDIPESQERAVLLSLAWNNPSLLGSGLEAAIVGDDRITAWYEIRYGSNGDELAGIAKRRYYESDLFQLYQKDGDPTTEEALQMGRMYVAKKDVGIGGEAGIEEYETAYGAQVTAANTDYGATVQTIDQSFGPAIAKLRDVYQLTSGGTEERLLVGSASADTLIGNDSTADMIVGLGAGDSLDGNGGADLILPGAGGGNTIALGASDGATDTVFIEFSASGSNTVNEFVLNASTGDRLDVTTLGLFWYNVENASSDNGTNTTVVLGGQSYVINNILKTDLFNPSNNAFIGLIGGTAGLQIDGNSSANTIYSNYFTDAQGDTVTANNDTIIGGDGNDSLYGQGGSDTYIFSKGDDADQITEDVHSGGTTGDINILRLSGVNSSEFYANSNNGYNGSLQVNLFSGGSGQGSVLIGNVWLNGSAVHYTASAGASFDIRYLQLDDVVYDVTKGLLWRGNTLTSGEYIYTSQLDTANDTVLAGDGADNIYTYAGNDSIDAGDGADVVNAAAGNDWIYGGIGNDSIDGYTGNDTMNGGADNDLFYANDGNDTYIWAQGDGDDGIQETVHTGGTTGDINVLRLEGVTLSEFYINSTDYYQGHLQIKVFSSGVSQGGVFLLTQWLNGSLAHYTSPSGASFEISTIILDDHIFDVTQGMVWRGNTLSSGEYIYTSQLSSANDTVLAGGGADNIYSYGGDDSIEGDTGADVIYAGDGNDLLFGQADNDALDGGANDDILDGGAGTDALYGGTGNDTFIVKAGEGNTGIYDTSGSNILDLDSATTYVNSGNDRTFTITLTGETVFVDDFNINSWSVI